jgi:thiosulfate/3-mercaptopyruvate sulfurtransferase
MLRQKDRRMTYTTLISVPDLKPRLGEHSWLIVDCRFDLDNPDAGRQAYLEGHIPGAVYADLERDLSAPKTASNGRHPLPSFQDLADLFSRLGVGGDTQVVAYDNFGGAFAARLWWSLRYMGHDAAAVLDGGFGAWKSAGLPLRSGEEGRRTKVFRAHARPSMLADAEEIMGELRDPHHLLLDARSPARFKGEEETRDPIAGHIPGALNHYWGDNMTPDEHFRPAAELKAAYEAILGGAPPEAVIAYCGSGVTGCHNILAMERAGLSGARLYAGSWSEWIADTRRPIATGDAARDELSS